MRLLRWCIVPRITDVHDGWGDREKSAGDITDQFHSVGKLDCSPDAVSAGYMNRIGPKTPRRMDFLGAVLGLLNESHEVRILIDGYNLLFQSTLVGRSRGDGWLQQARLRLIGWLAERMNQNERKQTTIVFDAHRFRRNRQQA
ncbi:MAG: NYN domain-containing protein, partial [Planctomycetota bacterium]